MATEFYRYVIYFFNDETAAKLANQYQLQVMLPGAFAIIKRNVLDEMYCAGQKVSTLVAQQIQEETLLSMRLSPEVLIGSIVGALTGIILIGSLLYQLYLSRRKVLRNEWLVPVQKLKKKDNSPLKSNFGENWEYEGRQVAPGQFAHTIPTSTRLSWSTRCTLIAAQEIKHVNVQAFMSLIEHQSLYYFIYEVFNRGTLHNVIKTSNFTDNYEFQLSVLLDIINGIVVQYHR